MSDQAYQRIVEGRKKFPGLSKTGLQKKLGMSTSSFYAAIKRNGEKVGKSNFQAKKRQGARAKVLAPKRKYQRIAVSAAAPVASGNVAVVIGTPEQVRAVLGGVGL